MRRAPLIQVAPPSIASLERSPLATVRLDPPDQTTEIVVDLLFASSGIEPEVVDEAELLEAVPGLWIPVASVACLVTMKLLSADPLRRPNDLADLQSLASRMSARDMDKVHQLIQLISDRGAARDRDLTAAFKDWVVPFLAS